MAVQLEFLAVSYKPPLNSNGSALYKLYKGVFLKLKIIPTIDIDYRISTVNH